MAKSSKQQVSSKHQKSINEFSSENITCAKLVKIAKSQQDALERLEKNFRKYEVLLVKEMEKNQELTEEHEALSSTLDDISNYCNSLSFHYESLSHDCLGIKNSNYEKILMMSLPKKRLLSLPSNLFDFLMILCLLA